MKTPIQWAVDVAAAVDVRDYLWRCLRPVDATPFSWGHLCDLRNGLDSLARSIARDESATGYEAHLQHLNDALAWINSALRCEVMNQSYCAAALVALEEFFALAGRNGDA